MSVARIENDRTRWVAPVEDKSLLFAPPVSQAADLLAHNRELLQNSPTHSGYDFQGRTFDQIVRSTREELLQGALAYTTSYRDVSFLTGTDFSKAPVILGGHQPDLFHPGVWANNSAISRCAQESDGVGLQLLIDGDVPKSFGVRIPTGTPERPYVEHVQLDQHPRQLPYEQWTVGNESLFKSFGERAARTVAPFVSEPFVQSYWPKVLARLGKVSQVGLALAQARHQVEGEWGLNTLELPQSQFSRSESFRWFTAHMLAHLPRLQEVYNSVLTEYRLRNHLRSQAQPVPDLSADDSGLEAPFWIWGESDSQRRPLFCRHRGDTLLLTDNKRLEWVLEATPEGDLDTAIQQLAAAEEAGVHIRSRALLTTMFARLFCGDLFVHGIGGGHYDQLTDEIIMRFFGFPPPRYMVVSGTLRLPVQQSGASPDDLRAIDRQLRDVRFNPDRLLAQNQTSEGRSDFQRWIDEKRNWIETPLTFENGSKRHQAIERCNLALQPFVEEAAASLRIERRVIAEKVAASRVLTDRDYAFCLFPKPLLREFVLDRVARAM